MFWAHCFETILGDMILASSVFALETIRDPLHSDSSTITKTYYYRPAAVLGLQQASYGCNTSG
eukprot:1234575-Amorphochlora_amoeboformis.AAC.1